MNGEHSVQPNEWSRRVAAALAAVPGVEVVGVDDLVIDLRVHGQSVHADLGSFYRAYRSAPEHHDQIMAELVQSLLGTLPIADGDDPVVLLARVLPMVKPLALLNEVYERQLPMLVYRPLVEDLMVAYVVDQGRSVGYLNERHLRTWGVTEAELYERALANLRAQAWTPHPGVLGAGKGALLIFNSRDGYDATRILLPELFGQFAARLPGTMVIGVPNRDFLIAFSDADQRVFDQIVAQIAVDARTQDHALTAQLFTFQGDRLLAYAGARAASVDGHV